jgi:hypothetical protein
VKNFRSPLGQLPELPRVLEEPTGGLSVDQGRTLHAALCRRVTVPFFGQNELVAPALLSFVLFFLVA